MSDFRSLSQMETMLQTDVDISVFLVDAFKTADATYINEAIGVAIRAKGINSISLKTGFSEETLSRNFSSVGTPSLKMTLTVMRALGVDMTATPLQKSPDTNYIVSTCKQQF